jgi:hypothetical protein
MVAVLRNTPDLSSIDQLVYHDLFVPEVVQRQLHALTDRRRGWPADPKSHLLIRPGINGGRRGVGDCGRPPDQRPPRSARNDRPRSEQRTVTCRCTKTHHDIIHSLIHSDIHRLIHRPLRGPVDHREPPVSSITSQPVTSTWSDEVHRKIRPAQRDEEPPKLRKEAPLREPIHLDKSAP